MWKILAIFNACRDRPVPDARIAIYSFRRTFQTAMGNEYVRESFSTVAYTPGPNADEYECVVQSTRIDRTEGYKQATQRYSDQVSLDANGLIQSYIAGAALLTIEASDPQRRGRTWTS